MKTVVVVLAVLCGIALAFVAPLPANAAETVDGSRAGVVANAQRAGSLGTCKTVYAYRYRKNPVYGFLYWKYIAQVKWCWKNHLITKIERWRDYWCCKAFTGWRWKGYGPQISSGGVGSLEYFWKSRGRFEQCLPYVLCTNDVSPWVAFRLHPGGGWRYATGT